MPWIAKQDRIDILNAQCIDDKSARLPLSTTEVQKELYMATRYRIHRFNLRMTMDQSQLEKFLNSLEGEVVSIIPNVTITPFT
jgi:hypothetical protein